MCPLGSVPYSNWMVLGTVTLYFPVVPSILWKLRFSSVLWTLALSPAQMETVLAHLNPIDLLLIQFWDGGVKPFSYLSLNTKFSDSWEENVGMGTSQQILIAA